MLTELVFCTVWIN